MGETATPSPRWRGEGTGELSSPLPLASSGSVVPPERPKTAGGSFTRNSVGGGTSSPSSTRRAASPTPNPSREREGLLVRPTLTAAAARFTFSATPCLDAELLMAHALGVSREVMILCHLEAPTPPTFAALVEARASQTPVAYLTGTRGFWLLDLEVGPGALVPRADSETLIEAALAHFATRPATVLDLGTGPGTLLLALLNEWPEAHGLGIDRSADALAYARRNAAALRLARRARFVQGEWATALTGTFDCIAANPPYIAADELLPAEVRDHEPAVALFGGVDGLDAYRAIIPELPRLLAPDGAAFLEIGATQAEAVTALAANHRLNATVRCDLGGRDRVVIVTAG